MNRDLKKRLAELKQPAAAKATVDAIRRKERVSPAQTGKIPTDVISATRKGERAEHEGANKEGGETIGEIVADLAKRAELEDHTADDLWPHLMGELDRRHLRPEEKSDRADIAKSSVSYFPPKKPKGYSITLARFRNIVSDARKKSR